MTRIGAVICPFSRPIVTGEPSCTARLFIRFTHMLIAVFTSFTWFLLAYFKQIKILLCFPFKFWLCPAIGRFWCLFFFLLGKRYNCNLFIAFHVVLLTKT